MTFLCENIHHYLLRRATLSETSVSNEQFEALAIAYESASEQLRAVLARNEFGFPAVCDAGVWN